MARTIAFLSTAALGAVLLTGFKVDVQGLIPIAENTVIRITPEPAKADDSADVRALRSRVARLEQAVAQMQQMIYRVQMQAPVAVAVPKTVTVAATPKKSWGCTIRTSFDIYTSTGTSKAKAMHAVVQRCKAKEAFASNCSQVECESESDA